MKNRIEGIIHILKAIEETQLQIVRKIAEGEVKVKLEKNLYFESDFVETLGNWKLKCYQRSS